MLQNWSCAFDKQAAEHSSKQVRVPLPEANNGFNKLLLADVGGKILYFARCFRSTD